MLPSTLPVSTPAFGFPCRVCGLRAGYISGCCPECYEALPVARRAEADRLARAHAAEWTRMSMDTLLRRTVDHGPLLEDTDVLENVARLARDIAAGALPRVWPVTLRTAAARAAAADTPLLVSPDRLPPCTRFPTLESVLEAPEFARPGKGVRASKGPKPGRGTLEELNGLIDALRERARGGGSGLNEGAQVADKIAEALGMSWDSYVPNSDSVSDPSSSSTSDDDRRVPLEHGKSGDDDSKSGVGGVCVEETGEDQDRKEQLPNALRSILRAKGVATKLFGPMFGVDDFIALEGGRLYFLFVDGRTGYSYYLNSFKDGESRVLCDISPFGRYTLVQVSDDFGEFVCRYAEEMVIDGSNSKMGTGDNSDDKTDSYIDVVMNKDNWIHLDKEVVKKITYDKLFDIVMKGSK